MRGRITRLHRNQNGGIFGFDIEAERNGETVTFFAHLGDLQRNEDLLFQNIEREVFEEGQEVEFDPWEPNRERAIHVRRRE